MLKGAAPLVKKQLVVLSVASIFGILVLGTTFLRVPEYLGINRYTVEVELAHGTGIYQGAEVTYLGHPVGRVTGLQVEDDVVVAELRVKSDVDVPADVTAHLHSRSAVGEQYLDFVPANPDIDTSVSLADGDRIPVERSVTPVEIGPVLDSLHALVRTLDPDTVNTVTKELGNSLAGRAGDLQQILDTSVELIDTANENFRPTARLLRRSGPLLDTINDRSPEVRRLTANLRQLTRELRRGDADLRSLLDNGPAFARDTSVLLDEIGAALPGLVRPADRVVGLLSAYDDHLQQLLSDLPMVTGMLQSVTAPHEARHDVPLTLATVGNPTECTTGYVPPSAWRSPFDTSTKPVDYVYCQEPATSPRGVRGARQAPCALDPARRTALAKDC